MFVFRPKMSQVFGKRKGSSSIKIHEACFKVGDNFKFLYVLYVLVNSISYIYMNRKDGMNLYVFNCILRTYYLIMQVCFIHCYCNYDYYIGTMLIHIWIKYHTSTYLDRVLHCYILYRMSC